MTLVGNLYDDPVSVVSHGGQVCSHDGCVLLRSARVSIPVFGNFAANKLSKSLLLENDKSFALLQKKKVHLISLGLV
jgi:hypothetical protein